MPIRDARCCDRAIKIDGQVFENCDFVNVLFVYEGGPLPSFLDCRLTNVQLRFDGAAAATAQLIGVWLRTPLAPFVETALKAVLAPSLDAGSTPRSGALRDAPEAAPNGTRAGALSPEGAAAA